MLMWEMGYVIPIDVNEERSFKMKMDYKTLFGILICVGILSACGNSPTELDSNKTTENQYQIEKKDSSSSSKDMDEEKSESENEEQAHEEQEKNNSIGKSSGLQEEYLQTVNKTKQEVDEMRENPSDETTFALKEVEGDAYEKWDGLLNQIYRVLEEQLPEDEMEQLRNEQREWIKNRDRNAKEASLQYEGGTMEQLEYVKVENNMTEKRCFELVEIYMK